MNIFATSLCPVEGAVALDDKRVIKMSLESAQMVSSALFHNYGARPVGFYAPTHYRHPCVLWAARDHRNFSWLVKHGLALLDEADWRWGVKDRKCRPVLEKAREYENFLPSCEGDDTIFQNSARLAPGVMDYTHVSPVTEAYRQYLSHKWRVSQPRWTRRDPPIWYGG